MTEHSEHLVVRGRVGARRTPDGDGAGEGVGGDGVSMEGEQAWAGR